MNPYGNVVRFLSLHTQVELTHVGDPQLRNGTLPINFLVTL